MILFAIANIHVGVNRLSALVNELPVQSRTFLVALLLDRLGKSKSFIKFPDMIQAANTYASEINWPTFTREETRVALETLLNYSLIRGGPTQFGKRMDFDEVTHFQSASL